MILDDFMMRATLAGIGVACAAAPLYRLQGRQRMQAVTTAICLQILAILAIKKYQDFF